MMDPQSHSSFQEHPFEISIKKLIVDFTELMDNKAIVQILIKQVNDCQVQFTETNFTAIFYTKFDDVYSANFWFSSLDVFSRDAEFCRTHSISSTMPIKLFVRVKERIRPNRCTYITTPTYIEITLIKDAEFGDRWYRLEPNEYSESRPLIPTSTPSTSPLALTYTSSIINNNNKGEILIHWNDLFVRSPGDYSSSLF